MKRLASLMLLLSATLHATPDAALTSNYAREEGWQWYNQPERAGGRTCPHTGSHAAGTSGQYEPVRAKEGASAGHA